MNDDVTDLPLSSSLFLSLPLSSSLFLSLPLERHDSKATELVERSAVRALVNIHGVCGDYLKASIEVDEATRC